MTGRLIATAFLVSRDARIPANYHRTDSPSAKFSRRRLSAQKTIEALSRLLIAEEVYIAEKYIRSHILVYGRHAPCAPRSAGFSPKVSLAEGGRPIAARTGELIDRDRRLFLSGPSFVGQARGPRSSPVSGVGRRRSSGQRGATRIGRRANPLFQHEREIRERLPAWRRGFRRRR